MAFGSQSESKDDESDEFSPLADINVTPFIDVMLVLLIIFMVTAPMLATGMKVDLPKARIALPLENQKPVVVTISAEGGLQVGDSTAAIDSLIDQVRSALNGEEKLIPVRGAVGARYGVVVEVLDLLAANGLTKIALVTDRRKAGSAATPSGKP